MFHAEYLVALVILSIVYSLQKVALGILGNWRLRTAAEVHTKLLEKFGAGQELLAYLDTEAGKRLLQSAPVEEVKSPYKRILQAVQTGVISTLLGVACLILRGAVSEAAQEFLVFGVLALSVGVAFLLSAAVTYFLSKSFGLLENSTPAR